MVLPPCSEVFTSLTTFILDEMGTRIDALESKIGDQMQQAGIENEGGNDGISN